MCTKKAKCYSIGIPSFSRGWTICIVEEGICERQTNFKWHCIRLHYIELHWITLKFALNLWDYLKYIHLKIRNYCLDNILFHSEFEIISMAWLHKSKISGQFGRVKWIDFLWFTPRIFLFMNIWKKNIHFYIEKVSIEPSSVEGRLQNAKSLAVWLNASMFIHYRKNIDESESL